MNGDELRQTFKKFWADIRGLSLYAGQPSNSQSAAAVSIAREAVRLATKAADADFTMIFLFLPNLRVCSESPEGA